jgi:hypothetical protein
MDIGFTKEQELLRASARRFLENGEHDPCTSISSAPKSSEVAFGGAIWHRQRGARLMTA